VRYAWVRAALLALLITTGCTIRYSQSLVGEIRHFRPGSVQNADSGTEFGLMGSMALFTISEPQSTDELLSIPCEVALAEVDYRAKWFGLPAIYVMPRQASPR
jgi:hypothetical protein